MNFPIPAIVALLFLVALVAAQGDVTDTDTYVVRLKSHGLTEHFHSQVSGSSKEPHPLRRVGADGKRTSHRLDARSPAALDFTDALKLDQLSFVKRVEERLGAPVGHAHHYVAGFNGVALDLTASQARIVGSLPDVERVFPLAERRMLTDAGPQWIGAPDVWDGDCGQVASEGDGIVIGVIDTGINPLNPSFLATDKLGYTISNPRGRYYGVCDPDNANYNPDFPCNSKLIGAYGYALGPTDPLDYDGHGSHVAGTAGGNRIVATVLGTEYNISGVAPHANIIAYAACCAYADIAAAIDQAIMDNVDVINYSIGNFPGTIAPFLEADTLGFLNARRAGVFVAISAGNEGPEPFTLSGPADVPWLTSAGAVTSDREFQNNIVDLESTTGPLASIVGGGISESLAAPVSIVYAGNYDDTNGAPNPLCDVFPNDTFAGQIVICDRGSFGRVEKAENVLAAGAGGYILANSDEASTVDNDMFPLPGVHIAYADGVTLKDWVAASSDPTAGISGTTRVVDPSFGDVLASFSSVGPSRDPPIGYANNLRDMIGPTIAAPGVSILAAAGTFGEIAYDVYSGTSMASPHLAGSAALLIALNPAWTPAEVESALISTGANTVQTPADDGTLATAFQRGGGSLRVSNAVQAGLVLDEAPDSFYCLEAGLPASQLNRAQVARFYGTNSTPVVTWDRTLTAVVSGTWVVSTATDPGSENVLLSASPYKFSLKAGQSVTVTLTADTTAVDGPSSFWYIFTPKSGNVATTRIPGAVYKSAEVVANDFSLFSLAVSRPSGSLLGNLQENTDLLRKQFRISEVVRSRETDLSSVRVSKLAQPDPSSGFEFETSESITGHTFYSFDNITKVFSLPPRTACLVNAAAYTDADVHVELYAGYGEYFDLGYGYDAPYYIYGEDYFDGVVCASKFVPGQVDLTPPPGVLGGFATCPSLVLFNTNDTESRPWWVGTYQENADEAAETVTLDVDALYCVSLDADDNDNDNDVQKKKKKDSLKVIAPSRHTVVPAYEDFQPLFKWNEPKLSTESPLWTSLVQWDDQGKPDSYSLVVVEYVGPAVRKNMSIANGGTVRGGDIIDVVIEVDTTVLGSKLPVTYEIYDDIPSSFTLVDGPVCTNCDQLFTPSPGRSPLVAVSKSSGCAFAQTITVTYSIQADKRLPCDGSVEFELVQTSRGWRGAKPVTIHDRLCTSCVAAE